MDVEGALRLAVGPVGFAVRRAGVAGEDVADLTAQCMEAVWRHLAEYDQARCAFATWVRWVCLGAVRDWRRWQSHLIRVPRWMLESGDFGVSTISTEEMPPGWEPGAEDPAIEAVADHSEALHRLREGMTYARRCGLTARQWECLVLRACTDRSLTTAERGNLGVARQKLRDGRAMLEA